MLKRIKSWLTLNSLVIRQKANLKTGVTREQSTSNLPQKRTFVNTWYAHVCTRTYVCVCVRKKCLFFGKPGVLCFLVTPVLRFALLPYCRPIVERENQNTERPQSFQVCRNRKKTIVNKSFSQKFHLIHWTTLMTELCLKSEFLLKGSSSNLNNLNKLISFYSPWYQGDRN